MESEEIGALVFMIGYFLMLLITSRGRWRK
jgi:hypothetical protein